jgi:hypothetical protein
MHSRSKKKSAIIKNHCKQTGGGGPCEVLNEIEERIAQSISKTAISGLEIEVTDTRDRLSGVGPCFRGSSCSCSRNRTTSRNSGSS